MGTRAQQRFTISGKVTDSATGEDLIGANISDTLNSTGTSTNIYGFYSLSLHQGKVHLAWSFVGYKTVSLEILLDNDMRVDIQLLPDYKIGEITITANGPTNFISSSQMSRNDMSIEIIKNIPTLAGEADVLKSLQLLPGVQSGGEGNSGIYVRGGNSDQNLILLDGVPVYNANHLFGFFSIFNTDALKNVTLYKGGFPARFGGRLSSVVDVRMKEGNNNEVHGGFSIGLLSSKFNIEGPILNDRTSYSFSVRRTYIDMITNSVSKISGNETTFSYYFYDLNAKVNHRFSDRSRLFLSAYTGRDKNYNGSDEVGEYLNYYLLWGNITTTLRWNYILSKKLFSNTSASYSRYSYKVEAEYRTGDTGNTEWMKYKFSSGIDDASLNLDFDYALHPDHAVKFGGNFIYHTFSPGANILKSSQEDNQLVNTTYGDKPVHANEYSLYAEDDFSFFSRMKANLGVRASAFDVQDKFFSSLEPRLSLRYLAADNLSFKTAYSKMKQYIHVLSSSTINLPTDLWLPVTKRVKPQVSEQLSLGGDYNFDKGFGLTVEGFYKKMDNLIEYKDGASFLGSTKGWEDKIETGMGWSYGTEIMINKTKGKTTGWFSYTLSWANRNFENINFGETFPARYDRRHDFNIVFAHKFSDRFDIGAIWVYNSGNPMTLSTHQYNIDILNYPGYYEYSRDKVNYYDKRNNYRLPDYHRLDIGMHFHKKKPRGIRTWSVDLYNAYNRYNPFYLYISEKYDQSAIQGRPILKQGSLFPVFPSISYNFKF